MKTFFSLFLLAMGVGLFFFYTNDNYQQIKNLQAQAADYNQALSQSNSLLAQRNVLKKQYDQISPDDLDRLQKLVPDSVDDIRLIIDINGIAARRGMTIKNIKINGDETPSNGAIALGPDTAPYKSLVLSFGVSAPYAQFKGFLEDLEQSLRIVDVTALSFTPTDKSDVYDYSISIRTYWLK